MNMLRKSVKNRNIYIITRISLIKRLDFINDIVIISIRL
nr:MAG TPA: hypothetical protein [Caudoviricetes sp.]